MWSILFVVLAVFSRLIPHLPGFTALVAVSVWSATLVGQKNRVYAFLIPLLALLISDLAMGFRPSLLSVYLPFGACVAVSFLFGQNIGASVVRATACTFTGGIVFFLLSNLGVWLDGTMYVQNFSGLIECYVNGLPFYRNQLAADFLFGAAFFLCSRLSSLFMSRTFLTCAAKKD